jgi:hypothetical protein
MLSAARPDNHAVGEKSRNFEFQEMVEFVWLLWMLVISSQLGEERIDVTREGVLLWMVPQNVQKTRDPVTSY